jgi:tetratricopeptide (TPR) repeat protein
MNDQEFFQKWRQADSALKAGDFAVALECFEELLYSKHDLSRYALAEIGNVLELTGEYEGARYFYEAAIDRINHEGAHERLANLLVSDLLDQPDYVKAFELLKKVDRGRNPYVHLLLGRLYKGGKGVGKDTKRATAHFLKSYRFGNLIALREIAHILKENGYLCRAIMLEIKASRMIWPIWRRDPEDPRISG